MTHSVLLLGFGFGAGFIVRSVLTWILFMPTRDAGKTGEPVTTGVARPEQET